MVTTLMETLVVETLRLRRLLGIQDARDEEVESRLFREDVEEDAVASPASPEFAVSESEATSVFSPMARGKETSPVVNKARSPAKRMDPDSVNDISPYGSPLPLVDMKSPSPDRTPIAVSSALSVFINSAIDEAAEAAAVAKQEVASLMACFFQSVESQAPIEVTQTVTELVDGVTGMLGKTPRWQRLGRECWEEVVEATQQCEAIMQSLWRLLMVGVAGG